MEKQKEIEAVHDTKADKNWQENVIIGVQNDEHSQEILDPFAWFQEMWDGRLGRIDMAKNCIKLAAQDVRYINSVLYHAEPRTHEFEKA